ncbi:helix-turn-helix domain-containing protein [Candidatus Peregrinibacteria bacterium]|nr:helix-turn-helix domain-containing protein [Candidatus Peregrinibacteria bacterium]
MRNKIFTSEQVADMLQIHHYTVLKYIRQGKLKASRIGRVYRIRENDVDTFLDDNMT